MTPYGMSLQITLANDDLLAVYSLKYELSEGYL